MVTYRLTLVYCFSSLGNRAQILQKETFWLQVFLLFVYQEEEAKFQIHTRSKVTFFHGKLLLDGQYSSSLIFKSIDRRQFSPFLKGKLDCCWLGSWQIVQILAIAQKRNHFCKASIKSSSIKTESNGMFAVKLTLFSVLSLSAWSSGLLNVKGHSICL